MLSSLEIMRKNFKDFLYYDDLRSIKVLDPCIDIRSMEDDEIWEGSKPVHPKPLVYAKIATGIVKMLNKIAENENKRRRTNSLEEQGVSGNDARHGRHNPSPREEWRSSEVTHGRGRDNWHREAGGRGGNRGGGGGRYQNYKPPYR
jgi:hypothetical protein